MSLLEIIQKQLSEAAAKSDHTNYRILEDQMVAELRRIASVRAHLVSAEIRRVH